MGESLLLRSVFILLLALHSAATSAPLDISLHDLADGNRRYVTLDDGWRFESGDQPQWSRLDFDDDDWLDHPSIFSPDELPRDPWVGVGWFRLRLTLNESLAGRPLTFYIHQHGASDIYVNGVRVTSIGSVGRTPQEEVAYHETDLAFYSVTFDSGDNLIAVRYSDHDLESIVRFAGAFGFQMGLGLADRAFSSSEAAIREDAFRGAIFTAVPATLALLHLLLFLFYRQARSNLYYALLTASLALLTNQAFAHNFTHDRSELALHSTLLALFIVATSITTLRFLYSLFYDQLPRLFHGFLVVGVVAAAGFWFTSVRLIHIYSLVCLAEGLRVVVVAVLHKKDGARVIGIGFCLFILACIYQLLGMLRAVPLVVDPVYQYGMAAMLATMSLYLARQVAGINGQLQLANARLTEHSRTLEERVAERTRELSEQNSRLEEVLGELRRTQNQMVLQEKMASLGGLVAGIAHEINTPMGAINSMHDTMSRAHAKLRKAIAGDVAIDATFDIIAEADRVIADGTRRVADLVQSLRTFAHLDEAEYQLVDINEGIDSTLTLLRMQAGGDQIEVVKEFGSFQRLYCAAGRLNQVFMSILKNAVEALGSADGKIVVRTYEDGIDLCVEIIDNGRGIPPEQLERIFNIDLARSAETVKMGFGLATSYATIEDHGGSIHIDSNVGEGTTVHIRLPRRQQGE